ncbi:ATP phosphoribosyltransferase regulatory subunit [Clostridia bacterium]|nr:ATP phosphoribosyltransferase regulatory subunit [Clostridia bacterium]
MDYNIVSELLTEYAIKNQLQQKITSVFSSYNYKLIDTPTFERIETFAGNEEKMYKFIGRDGAVLALRPDFTPQIAKILSKGGAGFPLRFFYVGNTFRCNENYQGKLNEFTQAGVELCGVSENCAAAEVIAVAISALISSGLTDFRVEIGHAGFLGGIFEEIGDSALELLKQYIIEGNFVGVKEITSKLSIAPETAEVLRNLMEYSGKIDFIISSTKNIKNVRARLAVAELGEIHRSLKAYDLDKYISFDLSLIANWGYYTGMIFRGYTEGASGRVVEGGRYEIGGVPSVGCALRVNDIQKAIESQHLEIFTKPTVTFLSYTQSAKLRAFACAKEWRKAGDTVENSVLGGDIDKNFKYAKEKRFDGMVYFMDDDSVILFDMETGRQKTVRVSEVMR